MKGYFFKRSAQPRNLVVKDPFLNTVTLMKFVNFLTKNGEKGPLFSQLKKFIIKFKSKYHKPFIFAFVKLLQKLRVYFILRTIQIAGKSFFFPIPVQYSLQYNKALHHFCKDLSVDNPNVPLNKQLLLEYEAVMVEEKGHIFRQNQNVKKSIIDNRAYMHFRWS